MSDAHLVDHGDGTFTAALHYPVPDVINDVGMNYRDALLASHLGLLANGRRTVIPVSEINPAEEFLIDTGQLYEHRLPQSSVLTAQELEDLYDAEQNNVALFVLNTLLNFGGTPAMPNFQILADELTNDPLTRGYAAMTDVQARDDVNTAYRDLWIELSSSQIFEAIDATEFQALNAANQARIDRLLGLGVEILSIPGSQSRSEIIAVFGGGSVTVANLAAIAQQAQTRNHELVWGRDPASTADIQFARTL